MTRPRTFIVALAGCLALAAIVSPPLGAGPPAVSTSAEGFKSEVVVDPATADWEAVTERRFRNLAICDLTLAQAVDLIRKETKLNILVETWRIEEAGIDAKRTTRLYLEDVRFDHAFAVMLSVYGHDGGLKIGERHPGVFVVSTPDGVAGTTSRMYDIRMLVELIQAGQRGRPLGPRMTEAEEEFGGLMTREEAADVVIRAVQETVEPDSWRDNGGSVGAIREVACRLLITQTPAAHKRTAAFLKELEQQLSTPMPPPTSAPAPATAPAAETPK